MQIKLLVACKMLLAFACIFAVVVHSQNPRSLRARSNSTTTTTTLSRRTLHAPSAYAAENAAASPCDQTTVLSEGFRKYFTGMHNIYNSKNNTANYVRGVPTGSLETRSCLSRHKECGWKGGTSAFRRNKELPLLVLSVGLEGAGHHLWTELLDTPVFDCTWKNARHYKRDVGDGVPRTTASDLSKGFHEMFRIRSKNFPPCRSIFDAEDSFPTGAIRKTGRVFMHPDIVNLQKLDGVVFNIKYLIINRNVTDTALSALRRNFVTEVDLALRAVESTLVYIESALQYVPCDRIFLAHYEHVLAEPSAYLEPLAAFLELDKLQKEYLKKRLDKAQRPVSRKAHSLTQYSECKSAGFGQDVGGCYRHVASLADTFFRDRSFMWPSFAGNGFNWDVKV
jgi:hypothetical protein